MSVWARSKSAPARSNAPRLPVFPAPVGSFILTRTTDAVKWFSSVYRHPIYCTEPLGSNLGPGIFALRFASRSGLLSGSFAGNAHSASPRSRSARLAYSEDATPCLSHGCSLRFQCLSLCRMGPARLPATRASAMTSLLWQAGSGACARMGPGALACDRSLWQQVHHGGFTLPNDDIGGFTHG